MVVASCRFAHRGAISPGISVLAADLRPVAPFVQPIATPLGLRPMQVLILRLGIPAELGEGAGSWACR